MQALPDAFHHPVSSTILTLPSAEKCRRIARRISFAAGSVEAFGFPECFVSSTFLRRCDEAKTLLKSQHPICAIGATGNMG